VQSLRLPFDTSAAGVTVIPVHSCSPKAYSEAMSHAGADLPSRRRLTVGDYYRMAEVGILPPDARVELHRLFG